MADWRDYDRPPAMRPGVGIDPALICNRPQEPEEWLGPPLVTGRQVWSGPSYLVGKDIVLWRFIHEPHGGFNCVQCIDGDGRVRMGSIHINVKGHSRQQEPQAAGSFARLRRILWGKV